MLICRSRTNLDEKILFCKITHLYDPKIRKMPVRSLHGNRQFHVSFWSMIYVALKCTLSVSEMNSFSVVSKQWTRMECGILVS